MHRVSSRAVRFFLVASLIQGSTAVAAEFEAGPAYLDQLPDIQIVIEPPSAGDATAPSLDPADLTLLEDGVPTGPALSIVPFGATDHGIAAVIALDVSGTMAGEPLEEISKALNAMVDRASSADRLALVTFADDVRLESGFGDSKERLRAAIGALAPRGRTTELYLALFRALELFDESPGLPARRRLLVISDGKDEGEAYRLDDVIERAGQREVLVDAIGFTRIDERYLSNLDRLAALSGGSYARARTSADLESLIGQGQDRVAATPVATFRATRLAAEGRPHRLGVRLVRGNRVFEDELRLLVPETARVEPVDEPPAEEPAEPAVAPKPWWRDLRWIGLAGLVGVLLVSVLVWRLARRGRTRAAAEPPASFGAAEESARAETWSEEPGPAVAAASSSWPGSPPHPESQPAAPVPVGSPPRPAPARPREARRTQFRTAFTVPRPGAPSALLIEGDGGGAHGIESSPFWIGAGDEADLQITSDDYMSSLHASIEYSDGTLLLRDNGSTNGTFVNEVRLGEVPRPLGPGDLVRVGGSTFKVSSA